MILIMAFSLYGKPSIDGYDAGGTMYGPFASNASPLLACPRNAYRSTNGAIKIDTKNILAPSYELARVSLTVDSRTGKP